MQSNPAHPSAARSESVDKLEECLRAEMSAVETYELALKSVTHVGLHHTLQEIFTSHSRRVEKLGEKLGSLGAGAPKSSGVWGGLAKILQVGADLLGNHTAIAALEAGEDHGLELYTKGLEKCDAKTKKIIETDLLPEQQKTHELCRNLKTFTAMPS